MAIKTNRPVTPSLREKTSIDYSNLSKVAPEKSLLNVKKKTGGRNNTGRITVRYIGGGNRQKYREIDFKRNKDNIPAKIATIEYDPNRSAFIALVVYADGEKRYMLAPQGLNVGDKIMNGANAEIKVGNTLPLDNIRIEARLVAKEGKYATIKMPSGELRLIPLTCRATIGSVSNPEHELVNYGKAGRKRHMGIKPHVRGVVMNPNDHPHGGGEGKSPIGHDAPRSPWGKRTQGVRTRNKRKNSSKRIISRAK